jgi:toxin HigB-1
MWERITGRHRCTIYRSVCAGTFPEKRAGGGRGGFARTLKPANRRALGRSSRWRRASSQLEAVATLEFLRSPPGNRLEALKGNGGVQFSIGLNEDVEIVDYH